MGHLGKKAMPILRSIEGMPFRLNFALVAGALMVFFERSSVLQQQVLDSEIELCIVLKLIGSLILLI
jgi:hypothetical protein